MFPWTDLDGRIPLIYFVLGGEGEEKAQDQAWNAFRSVVCWWARCLCVDIWSYTCLLLVLWHSVSTCCYSHLPLPTVATFCKVWGAIMLQHLYIANLPRTGTGMCVGACWLRLGNIIQVSNDIYWKESSIAYFALILSYELLERVKANMNLKCRKICNVVSVWCMVYISTCNMCIVLVQHTACNLGNCSIVVCHPEACVWKNVHAHVLLGTEMWKNVLVCTALGQVGHNRNHTDTAPSVKCNYSETLLRKFWKFQENPRS
jgi:hypothetical protein